MQPHEIINYLHSQGISESIIPRFFEKVTITDSCWFWIGGPFLSRYGKIKVPNKPIEILAHRVSYMIHFGPVPEGMHVLHDCPDGDCSRCVNPAHLWAGTPKQNMRDMYEKGRNPDMRGRFGPGAKLTPFQVDSIIEMARSGTTQTEISKHFQVTQGAISRILNRKSWKNHDFTMWSQ